MQKLYQPILAYIEEAYQALKDACEDLFAVNSVIKKSMNEEIPKMFVLDGLEIRYVDAGHR